EVLPVDIEPAKCKALLLDEGSELRNRELMLHDVEQHVAAITHREEVMNGAELSAQIVVADHLLAARADALRRPPMTPLGRGRPPAPAHAPPRTGSRPPF